MKEEFEQDVVHSVASQGETMSVVGIGKGITIPQHIHNSQEGRRSKKWFS